MPDSIRHPELAMVVLNNIGMYEYCVNWTLVHHYIEFGKILVRFCRIWRWLSGYIIDKAYHHQYSAFDVRY